MSLKDYKISDDAVQNVYVQSQPDILNGTTQENKAVFDKYPALIKDRFNAVLEILGGDSAASEILIQAIEGLTAGNVQQALAELKRLLDAYIAKIKSAAGAAEVGVSSISGVSGSTVQQALQSIKGMIDSIEAGTLPDGAVTSELIANGAVTEEKLESGLAGQIAVLGGATTSQVALANLGAGVRRNELINTRFLVNQRGKDSYTGNGGEPVTFDCWHAGLNTTISKSGENIVVSASGGEGYILQRIENPILEKSLVFSVLTTSGLYECKGVVNSGATITQLTPFGSIGVMHGARMYALIKISDGKSITLPTQDGDVVKLEVGSTQTLAYQDSDDPLHPLPQPNSDYAAQLAKCQRYQFALNLFNTSFTIGTGSITGEGNQADIVVPVPCTMRTAPAVEVVGTIYIQTKDISLSPSSMSVVNIAAGSMMLRATGLSGASKGDAVIAFGDSEGNVILNANL